MFLEKEDNYVGGKLLKTLQRNLPLRYILKDQEEFSRTGKRGRIGRTVLENTRIWDLFKSCYSLNTYFLLQVSSPSHRIKSKNLCWKAKARLPLFKLIYYEHNIKEENLLYYSISKLISVESDPLEQNWRMHCFARVSALIQCTAKVQTASRGAHPSYHTGCSRAWG